MLSVLVCEACPLRKRSARLAEREIICGLADPSLREIAPLNLSQAESGVPKGDAAPRKGSRTVMSLLASISSQSVPIEPGRVSCCGGARVKVSAVASSVEVVEISLARKSADVEVATSSGSCSSSSSSWSRYDIA